jgi:hypothetical protein
MLRLATALLTLALGAWPAAPAPGGSAGNSEPPRLPRLERVSSFEMRGPAADIHLIADVDLLDDRRIAVLDYEGRRVAVFSPEGDFERFLPPFPGVSPERSLIPRPAALPGGGLVLADQQGDRFLLYDRSLSPAGEVPFGTPLTSINGFVRHPSGDLYIAGYGEAGGKVLHRFDGKGRHLASILGAPGLAPVERADSSGILALDPDDGTLWFARVPGYELLHLAADGTVLGRIRRDRFGLVLSGKVAVLEGLVVHSYAQGNGFLRANVFARDGSLVASKLDRVHPLTMAKRVGKDLFARHFNEEPRRVELWRSARTPS